MVKATANGAQRCEGVLSKGAGFFPVLGVNTPATATGPSGRLLDRDLCTSW